MPANPLAYLGAGPASEQDQGVVRLATAAETIAGTSREIACTPYGVAGLISFGAPAASTSVAGILKTSTNGDAVAKVLSDVAVVPSNIPSIMAAPGAIGGTTPAAGSFTTLTATDIVLTNPLDVTEGGTGAATLTDHGVLLGSGTSAVSATSAGTTNQILISQGASSDPIFSSNIQVLGTLGVTGVTTLSSTASVVGTLTTAAVTASGDITANSNVIINASAKQLRVKGGAATDFIGTGTLANGTVTINNTNIAAGDRIFLQRIAVNGGTELGFMTYSISAGASFTVTSRDAAGDALTDDDSTFTYFIVRQI